MPDLSLLSVWANTIEGECMQLAIEEEGRFVDGYSIDVKPSAYLFCLVKIHA